ncbi:B12-binding domain-containing radical SAM protein [Marinitoga sp. 1155]|uniref:B12-binding domain-containing radical SAM protein n=1 Tax=Marinitoga sp. 1155 TaxID=1428448 RepID=UPI000640C189|nr:radical SAM protein [Marinitoga sp. 1155]KLO23945.1 radical SAM protein [Marinitoga sp. 1155]
MKHFLLINPWVYDTAAYDFWQKPLGLLYIGSILKYHGFEVNLIDLMNRYDEYFKEINFIKDRYYGTGKYYYEQVEKPEIIKDIPRKFKRYGLPEEVFIKKLKEYKNVDGIIVTSVMTYWYYGVYKTIEIIRKVFPEKPIFLGGIYVNVMPLHAKRTFEKLNVKVINGTGNIAIKKLFDFYNINIKNIDWFEELDPFYDLYSDVPYIVITSSIGCPFKCTYCVTPRMWKYQIRSVKKIIKGIENILSKKKVKDVVFFDDAFLIHPQKEELLEKLSQFKVRYHLPNGIHAKLVNKKIAKLFSKANFKVIKLGYETSDEEMQKKTGGKVSNEDLIRASNYLLNEGLNETSAYIMANLPGQKVNDVIKGIDFCMELGIIPSVNEFTPIPNTPQYMELVSKGWLEIDTDPLLLNNSILPYWWDYGMNVEEIEYIKAYLRDKKSQKRGI